MTNYDKKKLLKQEIVDIEGKIEEVRQDIITEAKANGTYEPGVNIDARKELLEPFRKFIKKKEAKEEELRLLIKEMLGKSEGLYDPVDIAKGKLKRMEVHEEIRELLQDIIQQATLLQKDIKSLNKLNRAMPVVAPVFITHVGNLEKLILNCETEVFKLKHVKKKEIEKEIKAAEEKKSMQLKDLEAKEAVAAKYKDI
ncbi:hypothetical protein SAMN05660297_02255 [Natronincola peptidivorans]|uniref:Uncharacterized protein n=1 Tax=Natronincola peptidivorans TaxID=426128 RepID=A0A1I0E1R4_9FIRM|nr:hypothetical protein [Natronincola peptidivorans]SET38561.1 hypothetical protein SAMN05660297_02255 [Natronincola peptidivorans]